MARLPCILGFGVATGALARPLSRSASTRAAQVVQVAQVAQVVELHVDFQPPRST